ncbi:MAG TPA: capsid cement protein [Verrucomicrobiae bacterium]
MGIEVYTDTAYRTFTEKTPGQLTGKEGYLVELTSDGLVQLLASGLAIGVMHGKLESSNDVNIRLLGKGGTMKCVKSGAIAVGARVKGASGGKITTTTTGDRSIGIIISPTTNGADGDVCEVLDIVEKV